MLPPVELIELARVLGDPINDLCIEAEGNVSAAGDNGTLWIKGSGLAMKGISADGFACVQTRTVLDAVRLGTPMPETGARDLLNRAKVDRGAAIPSTETFMHASLLARPGSRFIAHGHPTPLLSLLVLPEVEAYCNKRLFPDEIVLCGPATCFIPYVAPGLPLAQEIDRRADAFAEKYGVEPKTFWLENHGYIAVGRTHREAISASLMVVKAARVLLGALQTGQEPKWLTDREVDQIYRWPDEHERQRRLWGTS